MVSRIVVECSEPGVVIASAEGVEHALRHMAWDDVLRLKAMLGDLAREIGPGVAEIWNGFKAEVSNEAGWTGMVPSFGLRTRSREDALEAAKRLTDEATRRGYGRFEAGGTLLMPQREHPETREQYIADLADAVCDVWTEAALEDVYSALEDRAHDANRVHSPRPSLPAVEAQEQPDGLSFRVYSRPIPVPRAIAEYRERLARELAASTLAGIARRPEVGHRWTSTAREAAGKGVDEIGKRADAVVAYELEQRDPASVPPAERLQWLALAVRTGQHIEKWYPTVESLLAHPSQKACLAHGLAWGQIDSPSRRYLIQRLEAAVVEANGIYTPHGVAALEKIREDMKKDDPWERLRRLQEEAKDDGKTGRQE